MTFTLGRIPLANVGSWSPDLTGRIRVSGNINNNTAEINQHWASQLLELLDTGRRASIVLPLVWDENPSATGYYEVLGGSVVPLERIPIGWRYDLDLQKLPGGNTLPAIESVLIGGYRPNLVSVANVAHASNSNGAGYLFPEWAVPAPAVEMQAMNPTFLSAAYDTRRVQSFESGYWTKALRWAITAANFYAGACLIEQKIGSTWLPVVGTQAVVTDTTTIRISNGYMGLTFGHPTAPNTAGMQFAGFGRTAGVLDWTAKAGFMPWATATSGAAVNAITILRNDPEEIRLRFSLSSGTYNQFSAVDVSLRRGLDYVTLAGTAVLRFDSAGSVASTSIAEGMYRTATTGGLQPWILTTGGSVSVTKDTTVGTITVTNGGGPVAFGVGPVYDATAATVGFSGSVARWFAPLTERQRIVGR